MSVSKMAMIRKRIGGYLEPLGFTVDQKDKLDIQYVRKKDGMKQYILIQIDRYANMVTARYDAETPFKRPHNWAIYHRHQQIEYMRNNVPGWRPGEGEWIWFDGDEDFPRALDTLVSVIEGYGLKFLEIMCQPSREDENYDYLDEPKMPELRKQDPASIPKQMVLLKMNDQQLTDMVNETVGKAIAPYGFVLYVHGSGADSWLFHRFIKGKNFPVMAQDRRGFYTVESDEAEEKMGVELNPQRGLAGIHLETNVMYEGCGYDQGRVMCDFIRHIQDTYPEAVNGYWFPYHDEESFQKTLVTIGEAMVRFGIDALDEMCAQRPHN
jgi:hypothetical protein